MKKKIILGVAGILFLIIAVMGLIAPREFVIEKTVTIEKTRFFVFDRVKFLKGHEAWNPWAKRDRSIKYDWKGTDGAVGFTLHWVGNNKVGEGEQEIKKIVEGERIEYELRFKKPIKTTHTSYVTTTEDGDTKTKVTWGMKGKINFPFNILFMVFKMKAKLEYDFTEGLNVLKAILEKEV